MERFTTAVRQASAEGNSYAALALALMLPDICASMEASDGKTSGARYAAWWDTYLLPSYTSPWIAGSTHGTKHVFLAGGDCYALRCAFLHQGIDDTTDQRARVALEKFQFVQPTNPNTRIHLNQSDAVLNLQVNVFCEDICQGVEAWQAAVSGNADVLARLTQLMTIDDLQNGWSF